MGKPSHSAIDVRAWVKENLADFHETPRSGVPRGDELPIPRHKYHAALLMLSYGSKHYPDLLKIAQESGVTYTLLGKWRSERKFQKLIQKLAAEYLAKWFEFFIWLSNEIDAHQGTKDEAEHKELLAHIQALCHATWGEHLQVAFSDRFTEFMGKSTGASPAQGRLLEIMETWIWSGLSAKKKNLIVDLKKETISKAFEQLQALAVKAVEDSDKKGALQIIEMMRQSAVNLGDNYWELVRSTAVAKKVKG